VSIWITQYGKYGEYVCSAYGGGQLASKCDANMDGVFDEACALGKVCDPSLALNGGCGDRGACTLAETVTNAHRLRPESGGSAGPCGPSEKCAVTMTLAPDHRKIVKDLTSAAWVEFEFKTPVPVEKWTTYFINAAVVGNIDISKEVKWVSGKHHGDGGANNRNGNALAGADTNPVSDELRAVFLRDKADWRWKKQTEKVLATKLTRCVSSTAQVMGFTTSGEIPAAAPLVRPLRVAIRVPPSPSPDATSSPRTTSVVSSVTRVAPRPLRSQARCWTPPTPRCPVTPPQWTHTPHGTAPIRLSARVPSSR